jgi:hypothetical protein
MIIDDGAGQRADIDEPGRSATPRPVSSGGSVAMEHPSAGWYHNPSNNAVVM